MRKILWTKIKKNISKKRELIGKEKLDGDERLP